MVAVAASRNAHDDPQETDIDDIESYIATYSEEEAKEFALAETAIDIAILLHRARELRGLTQAAAAAQTGLRQQAISRFEQPHANPQLGTLQKYLSALGYALEITVVDPETGNKPASVTLPPQPSKRVLVARTARPKRTRNPRGRLQRAHA
jgi:transcriptional regulator with XRE-family HTH domain